MFLPTNMPTSKKRKKGGKKVVKKVEPLKKAICPHCDGEIDNVQWRPFGNNDVQLICHLDCMYVLGATFNFKK